ncbi:MAG: ribosome silencing factor [Coriobacteriales bacterium]|nr:ribosome silencing factor [Coriobacteriales bacterium]
MEGLLTSREYALLAASAADAKKGSDIIIQDVSELLQITDYFVVVTGQNARQVDSIQEAVEEKLTQEAGLKPISIEGLDGLDWVLMDFGSIIVHVFQPDIRDFYRLETLWGDAPIVDLSEAGIQEPVFSQRIQEFLER